MIKQEQNENLYQLTEQQRTNINKRLPIGFCLVKLTERAKYSNKKFTGPINYIPVKPQPKIVDLHQNDTFSMPILAPPTVLKSQSSSYAGYNPQIVASELSTVKKASQNYSLTQPTLPVSVSRLSSSQVTSNIPKANKPLYQLPQNKSRQSEKIKNIIQRLRKHSKFPQLALHLNRLGFLNGFSEIQSQSRKNLHSIDSFKDRCMYIFNRTRSITYSAPTLQLIDEMIDEFLCYVEQAKKNQFEQNLQGIQKSIDKITRQISDIKEQGNWYLRKKKKSEKTFDEKEIIYIAELVTQLPKAYLVGIWEIIQERPFPQSSIQTLQVDYTTLKQKKLREIQYYVKKKLTNLYKSRERKKEKIQKKKQEKRQKMVAQKRAMKDEKEREGDQKDKEGDKQQHRDIFKSIRVDKDNIQKEKHLQDQNKSRSQKQSNKNSNLDSHIVQFMSPKSQNQPLMPATPSFNPKKDHQIPTFPKLDFKSEPPVKKPSPIANDDIDDFFGQDIIRRPQPPASELRLFQDKSVDNFLNLDDDNDRYRNDDKSEGPRIIDSPFWVDDFQQSDLLRKIPIQPANNRIEVPFLQPYPKAIVKQDSADLQFEPINMSNLTAQKKFTSVSQDYYRDNEQPKDDISKQETLKKQIREKDDRLQINPPSFQQGDALQFQKMQDEDKEDQFDGIFDDHEDEQYQSSDSSMISDQDDSDF